MAPSSGSWICYVSMLFMFLFSSFAEGDLVAYRLELTDLMGTTIDEISVGDSFLLVATVEDVRPDPTGVFSAYFDVEYDAARLSVADLTYDPDFPNARSGSIAADGLIDEAGAIGGFTPTGGGTQQLFSIEFAAEAAGLVEFTSNAADFLPQHATTVYGDNNSITDLSFGSASLRLVAIPEPSAFLMLSVCACIYLGARCNFSLRERS